MGEYLTLQKLCVPCKSHCLHCDALNQCYICESGYAVIDNGLCENCDVGCASCWNNSKECIRCDDGYYFVDQKCKQITDRDRIACVNGEYADSKTNKCVRCENDCLMCDQMTGKCLTCFDQINMKVSGDQCVSRCVDPLTYYQIDNDKVEFFISQFLDNSPLVFDDSGRLKCQQCSSSSSSHCTRCAFEANFCVNCEVGYFNYKGLCVEKCSDGSFPIVLGYKQLCIDWQDYNCFLLFVELRQYQIIKSPRGCLECTWGNVCVKCDEKYILNKQRCVNSNVYTSLGWTYESDYYLDGHVVSVCPKTTLTVGSRCLPMNSCRRVVYQIDTQDVLCVECADKSLFEKFQETSGLGVPEIKATMLGRCYETCPFKMDKLTNFCVASCGQGQLSTWNKGAVVKCSGGTCLSPYLNRYCVGTLPCSQEGYYIDLFADTRDEQKTRQNVDQTAVQNQERTVPQQSLPKGVQITDEVFLTQGDVDQSCVACQEGCKECMRDGNKVICLGCLKDFDTFQRFSLADPTQFKKKGRKVVEFYNVFCVAKSKQLCDQQDGYYADTTREGKVICAQCTEVNQVCKKCEIEMYLDTTTMQCVPYCGDGLYLNEETGSCYSYPHVQVEEVFDKRLVVGQKEMNVANTFFKILITISSDFKVEFVSGKCSVLSGFLFDIVDVVSSGSKNVKIVVDVPRDSRLKRMLVTSRFDVFCECTVVVNDRMTMTVSGFKKGVFQIASPNGDFSITPVVGDNLTKFTVVIKSWKIDGLSEFSYSLFTYELGIVGRHSKDLNVKMEEFKIKGISYQENEDLYPSDKVSLTEINYSFYIDVQSQEFNDYYIVLRVTPMNMDLAHLVKQIKIPIVYTFTPTPQYVFKILMQKFIHSNGTSVNALLKQTMKVLADEVYSRRGDIPTHLDKDVDLNYEKLKNFVRQINLSILCDKIENCSGQGQCKRRNSNFYKMCDCDIGWTGERCNWNVYDLKQAQTLVYIHLDSIIDDISWLDGEGLSVSGGLRYCPFLFYLLVVVFFNVDSFESGGQIVSLLQFWTDSRDVFKLNSFEKLMKIFSTDVLSKVLKKGINQRLLYVLNNMIDILRTMNVSSDKFEGFQRQISSQITNLYYNIMSQMNVSLSVQTVVDMSNFKGCLLHNAVFQQASKESVQIELPNEITVEVFKELLSSSQYLEIIVKPLDLMQKETRKIHENYLIFMLSNILSITVRELDNGREGNVDGILVKRPLRFDLSFVLPSRYLSQLKNITCVYWDDSVSEWTTRGVSFVKKNGQNSDIVSVSCSTSHLSDFGLANVDTMKEGRTVDLDLDVSFVSAEYQIYIVVLLVLLGSCLLVVYCLSLCFVKNVVVVNVSEVSLECNTPISILQGVFPGLSDNSDCELSHQSLQHPSFNQIHSCQLPQVQLQLPSQDVKHVSEGKSSHDGQMGVNSFKNRDTRVHPYLESFNLVQSHGEEEEEGLDQIKLKEDKCNEGCTLPQTNVLKVDDITHNLGDKHGIQYDQRRVSLKKKKRKGRSQTAASKEEETVVVTPQFEGLKREEGSFTAQNVEQKRCDVKSVNCLDKKEEMDVDQVKAREQVHQDSLFKDCQSRLDIRQKESVWQKMKPYLTVFCWKYSYVSVKNTERVLFTVVITSAMVFTSSQHLQFNVSNKSRDVSTKSVLVNTAVVLLVSEIITWMFVAVVSVRRLIARQICFNCTHRKITSVLLQFCNFVFSFALFFVLSYIIIAHHQDQSQNTFYCWIVSYCLAVIISQAVEWVVLYCVMKCQVRCLILLIKYKRLDF